jgi:hypothetical protein
MGVSPEMAITMIRKEKSDSLNATQVAFLKAYRPKKMVHQACCSLF